MAVLIPLALELGLLPRQQHQTPLLFFVMIGVGVSLLMRYAVFPCPHCSGQMKVLGTFRRREADRCPQCGIAVGTPKSEPPDGQWTKRLLWFWFGFLAVVGIAFLWGNLSSERAHPSTADWSMLLLLGMAVGGWVLVLPGRWLGRKEETALREWLSEALAGKT